MEHIRIKLVHPITFIFFDHYSFRNTKNHYYPLVQLKTIFETMIQAHRLRKVNY